MMSAYLVHALHLRVRLSFETDFPLNVMRTDRPSTSVASSSHTSYLINLGTQKSISQLAYYGNKPGLEPCAAN